MHWLLPLQDILVQVWNPGLFGAYENKQTDSQQAGDVSLEKITKSIRSKWFWAFMRMCNEVCAAMVRLTYWIESCPCHSHLIKVTMRGRYEKHQRSIVLRKLIAKGVVATGAAFMWDSCPMGGKHAAELACGAASDLLEDLFVRGLVSVLSNVKKRHYFIRKSRST